MYKTGLLSCLVLLVVAQHVNSAPVEDVPSVPKTLAQTATTSEPEMVPISSTVITVVSPKQPSARQTSSNIYSRRFRFFDKSTKPDEPFRLITKGTSLRDAYVEQKSE